MASKLLALAGTAALGLLVSLSASAPADARGGYHGGGGGHIGHFSRFGGHLGHGHHGFHRRVFVTAPFVYGPYAYDDYDYDDDYGYADDSACTWLRHRAVVTGKSYWRRRYEACIADD